MTSSAFNPVESVELFHLLFLDQLVRKVDKRTVVIKGGCNLRFFFHSIRYSEDLDLDVSGISVDALSTRVDQILKAPSFQRILAGRGLTIVRCTAPKQTETTQRWKFALSLRNSTAPLHTKIEFSRRGISDQFIFEPVDPQIVGTHGITPILVSHYDQESAFRQKIEALIHRSNPQARDIFDLDHLLRCGVRPATVPRSARWKDAEQNALALTFESFASQVLSFLSPEYRSQYDSPSTWDDMVLRVTEALKAGAT